MKKINCLLLVLNCVILLCACGESHGVNSVDTIKNNITENEKTEQTSKKEEFDLSKLSKDTTFDDVIRMLGDSHTEREDETGSIKGEVYHITYPKGTVLSGLESSSNVYVEFFQTSNKLREIHFDFVWEGENIVNFDVVKESLDKIYGQAKESGKSDYPFAPDRIFRWRSDPDVFCNVWIGDDSRLCLCF